jgi:hypothetical protein
MDTIESNDDGVIIRLSRDEVGIANNALNEILHGPEAIEEWEFHTRIGATREEARLLLVAFSELLG